MTTEPRERDLDLAWIEPPPHQLRETIDPEALGQLADDIAAQGLLQAIGVREIEPERRYQIGFGHRRYLAHHLLRRHTIRARVWPANADLLAISIAENHFRKDLNPIEDARAMRALEERGEPIPHIARRYRISEATVRARLHLLSLPTDLQHAIATGALSVAVAMSLADVDYEEYRTSLIAEAERTGASARVAAVWVAAYAADRDRIVSNHLTVQEIVARREEYVIYFRCDACRTEVPYPDTESRRFCRACAAVLSKGLTDFFADIAPDA